MWSKHIMLDSLVDGRVVLLQPEGISFVFITLLFFWRWCLWIVAIVFLRRERKKRNGICASGIFVLALPEIAGCFRSCWVRASVPHRYFIELVSFKTSYSLRNQSCALCRDAVSKEAMQGPEQTSSACCSVCLTEAKRKVCIDFLNSAKIPLVLVGSCGYQPDFRFSWGPGVPKCPFILLA